MYTLITFATQWGSKHGGLNSFNADFLTAFGFAYSQSAQVICLVASCDKDAIDDAAKSNVMLVPLPYDPAAVVLGHEHAQAAIGQLAQSNISFERDRTVWLGHDRITGKAAVAAAKIAGGRSAVIHHMSYADYEPYAEDSRSAQVKIKTQTELLESADVVFAIGPLLRDAAKDRISRSKPVCMLIPGLAEIVPRDAPNTFTAFMSGRFTDNAARIKQGQLGIAGFATASREARDEHRPEALRRRPRLVLRGVDFEGQITSGSIAKSDPELELKQFAEKYASAAVNLQALPYTQNRQDLYSELSGSSVALMPSWHEGFGLVAWEAIAAGVPLVITEQSGVYRLLEEEYPGAGTGCVFPIDISGAESEPFFNDEDLETVVEKLKAVADNPLRARKQASILRNLLGEYTWPGCAEQAVKCLGWEIEKGTLPPITTETIRRPPDVSLPVASSREQASLLRMPTRQWRAEAGMADSQLLRAEEALLPFDPARQPDVNTLNEWLDDIRFPQAVRLITGAGGQGKTRLALELCKRRESVGWKVGFLDSGIAPNQISTNWLPLRQSGHPHLIVIDYAETRQIALLALVKAVIQYPTSKPIRILLLARDGGEWWDNLPSRDPDCEALLSGYATTGPFRLPALYATESDRHVAFKTALDAFAKLLGVGAPDIDPQLQGEHFERPLYVQIAALLALYGERPVTAEGLTKGLLNHERRYWKRLLDHFAWPEPERRAEQLLTLATLGGGFSIPREARHHWDKAGRAEISNSEFNALFRELATLYPGTQGLEALKPDLLGEALVAQALLRPQGDSLLDAVLTTSATHAIRENALTVLARLSTYRLDLEQTIVDALQRNAGPWKDMVDVSTQTVSRLPEIAEQAFLRLSYTHKSQIAGLLHAQLRDESVQLAKLACVIDEHLVRKTREKFEDSGNMNRMLEYAGALLNYGVSLARIGQIEQACEFDLRSLELFERLRLQQLRKYEADYALLRNNLALHLGEAGQNEQALTHAREALEIRKRLAATGPELFEPVYADSLDNLANRLSDLGQTREALQYAEEALKIRKRFAETNPDRFEPDYAQSLNNVGAHLRDIGERQKARDLVFTALQIRKRLAQKNPDRFEPHYAGTLHHYAVVLAESGQYDEALKSTRQALEIRKRLARKNPERYEYDYAMSLNTFANLFSEAGKNDEALERAHEALEIFKRLAQKSADRFESGYAMALSNYGIDLANVGSYDDALVHARMALEIRSRLSLKGRKAAAEDTYRSIWVTRFLAWLCNEVQEDERLDVDKLLASTPPHQQGLMVLFSEFAKGCVASNQMNRGASFKRVLEAWNDLSFAQQREAEAVWLCSMGWCRRFYPDVVGDTSWEAVWQQFAKQRQGRVPQWMIEVASRLGFQWPSVE